MEDKVKLFLEVRRELFKEIAPSLQVFFCGIWDPCCEYQVTKEAIKVVKQIVELKYPECSKELLPQFLFRRADDNPNQMEVMVQEYLNHDKNLKYLGSPLIDDHIHDVYIRPPFFMDDYKLVVRYGHEEDHYVHGGDQAEIEYHNGIRSPLSIAYQLALDAGEI